MQDNVTDIRRHYDAAPANEHDRLVRHPLEFDMTMALFKHYLPQQSSILEIGAATGRYTVALLRQGHRLTVADLSPEMIATCKRHVAEAGFSGQVGFHLADARDLSSLGEIQFDVVLPMEPLYHLVEETDRTQALQEVYHLLRPDGLIFSAFISRYGIFGDLMAKVPEWIESSDEVRAIIDHGRDPADWPRGGFRGYFALVDEIAPLHERLGFQTIEMAAVEPAISADDEAYNRLEGEQRWLWFELLFEIRNNPSTLGASRHLLYVGRKRS